MAGRPIKIEKENIHMISALPFITQCRELGPFFKRTVEGKQVWQFFNPMNRTWQSVKRSYENEGTFLVFREGWVVRRLSRRDTGHDYYQCDADNLHPILKGAAEFSIYESAPGERPLKCAEKDGRLYVYVGEIYLPWPHREALRLLADHVREDNGRIEVMVYNISKKPQVDLIFRRLRFRLTDTEDFRPPPSAISQEESDAYRKLLQLTSEIFTLAYSDYLKREDAIEHFILDIIHRTWDRIPSPELRERLCTLVNSTETGNHSAKALYEFLVNKLPIYFGWENLGTDRKLGCVIVDGTPQEFQEKWSTNYFRLIVPSLECCLYWQTTVAPIRIGKGHIHSLASRLLGVEIGKWRIYPYLGKLRLTGSIEDVDFAERPIEELRQAFYSIVGVPSFELLLREHAYIDGYNLDRKEWRGGYNFSRFFLALVKIEEPLMTSASLPTTVVKDIFGNHFGIQWGIDNYIHEKERIHAFSRDGWISVLLENKLNAIDPDYMIPLFQSAEQIGPRFVKKEDAYISSLVGLVRYCGFISEAGFKLLAKQVTEETEFVKARDHLIMNKKLIQMSGFYFYVHNRINADQASILAELTVDPKKLVPKRLLQERWYQTWALVRSLFPYVHPLIWGKGLFIKPLREPFLADREQYQLLREFIKQEIKSQSTLRSTVRQERLSNLIRFRTQQISYNDTLIGDKEPDRYISYAIKMLQNFGYTIIKARGRWIQKAHFIAQKVEQLYAFASPRVRRRDILDPLADTTRLIPAVEFDIQIFGTEEGN